MTGSIEITGTTAGARGAGTAWTSDIALINPEPWMQGASCASANPEEWFPEKGVSSADAKKVCAKCDVVAECLAYALEHDEQYGVWGGMTRSERRQLKRDGAA